MVLQDFSCLFDNLDIQEGQAVRDGGLLLFNHVEFSPTNAFRAYA
jgi:hypothetical protein